MGTTWRWSAHEMLAHLEAGDVSSLELVSDCFERMDEVNDQVNAVVVTDRDQTLADAKAVDSSRANGEPQGPLAGLPYTAKLDYDVVGQATSQGTSILSDAIAPADAPMIERMRAAGAVLLGRTNQPDFGVVYHTNSTLYGLTRNPWANDRSPGGSSGGEGAAVATGISPLGLGSDIGGSIRGPASLNGVTGLKPGLGRYPDASFTLPDPPIHEQLFTARGPLARSVRDLVIVDHVLRGLDLRDPWSAPAPPEGPRAQRVGVVLAPTEADGSPHIVASVRAAASALAERGYEVEEAVVPGWQDLLQTFIDIMSAGFGGDPAAWQLLHPDTQFFLEHVHRQAGAGPLDEALARRAQLVARFNDWHGRYDVLVMPTWTGKTFRFDELLTGEGIDRTTQHSRHLYLFNLLGVPGLSVPVGLAEGLPVGLHISSTRFREDAVLQVGLDVEAAFGALTPIDPR